MKLPRNQIFQKSNKNSYLQISTIGDFDIEYMQYIYRNQRRDKTLNGGESLKG